MQSETNDKCSNQIAKSIVEAISSEDFGIWKKQREIQNKIESGNSILKKSDQTNTCSKLLQCHRKLIYRENNSPAENTVANEILWYGGHFEENLLLPYIRQKLSEKGLYVASSVYIDFSYTLEENTLQFTGVTDPVIINKKGDPILATEIKTKKSIKYTDEPSEHHVAQLYTHLLGISLKFDVKVDRGLLIYASRRSHRLKIFTVKFDAFFWERRVGSWIAEHTKYRRLNQLPPPDSEFNWECDLCSFKQRCGKGELSYENVGTFGLLDNYSGYKESQLIDYLEAHNAKLTPTLAQQYSELGERYGVYDWYCKTCNNFVTWKNEHANSNADELLCPSCAEINTLSSLSDPTPKIQKSIEDKPEMSRHGC